MIDLSVYVFFLKVAFQKTLSSCSYKGKTKWLQMPSNLATICKRDRLFLSKEFWHKIMCDICSYFPISANYGIQRVTSMSWFPTRAIAKVTWWHCWGIWKASTQKNTSRNIGCGKIILSIRKQILMTAAVQRWNC